VTNARTGTGVTPIDGQNDLIDLSVRAAPG
jgi:hypothetical protein